MLSQPAQPASQDRIPSVANELSPETIPSCSVCGRQDETLRIASLPYVISIIVVTFRRAMTGLWCRRHRNSRLFIAGSITAILGWVGIPYGFIYTPVALFNLARGGNVSLESNLSLLKRLAEHKLRQGDIQGAVRCLEEVLKLGDDEEARTRLGELYAKYTLTLTGEEKRAVLPLLVPLIGAPLIGLSVGLVDYLIASLFKISADQEISIFLVILSWVPLVAGIYIGGIVLTNLLGWALSRYRPKSQTLGLSMAVVSAGFATYGVPTGRIMTEFLGSVLAGPTFESLGEFLQAAGAFLTRGGGWLVRDAIQVWGTAGIIYLVILLAALVYFQISAIAVVRSISLQQKRIAGVKPAPSARVTTTDVSGWLMLVSALAAAGLLVALFLNLPASQYSRSPAMQHADLAEQLYQQGNFAEAANELEQAIVLEPDTGILHANLGWAYLQQGRFLEARQEFQVAIELAALSADTYLGLGIAQYALQDYQAAYSSLQQVLDANPPDGTRAQAHYGLALISNMHDDLDMAILNLELAVQFDPTDVDYKVNLGWAHYHGGDYQEAEQIFQDALRLDQDNFDAALGIAFAQLRLEDYAGAEGSFEVLLEMNLDGSMMNEVYLGLALAYEAQNNLADSAEYLEMSLTLSPAVETRAKLIYVLMGMGELEAALDQCDIIIADQPDWAAPTAIKAWVYFALGEPEIAESLLNTAQSLQADDIESVVALALASRTGRKFPEAEAFLLRARELAPENESVFFTLAYVLSSQAKYDEAMDVLEEWLALDDASALAYASVGSVWVDQGDLDRGYAEYSRALDIDPESDVVLSGLSFIHFHQGQIDDALGRAQEAVRLNPYSASGYKNLAFAYHAQGNCEQAIEAAQEALRLYPAYDEAHYILGVCYMEMEEYEKAIESFERFLDFYYDRAFVRGYKPLAEAYLEDLQ